MKVARRIILVRHAQAVDREEFDGDDADRPLTPKGRQRAEAMAQFITNFFVLETACISHRLRSRETFAIFAQVAKTAAEVIETNRVDGEHEPADTLEFFFDWFAEDESRTTLYVFGHEPHLSRFLSYCCDARPNFFKVKKSGISVLEVDLTSRRLRLESFIPPSLVVPRKL